MNSAESNSVRGPAVGDLVGDKYRITGILGEGGMGVVFRATHQHTGREVALKTIRPSFAASADFQGRFESEARAIGALRHPNIVDVTDFGYSGQGEARFPYLVLEFLEGYPLAQTLRQGSGLPWNWATSILEQVCLAVSEAHRVGIVHGDIKPENVWLSPRMTTGFDVKVLDFGLARFATAPRRKVPEPAPEVLDIDKPIDERTTMVRSGTGSGTGAPADRVESSISGTPPYMSPERWRGEALAPASDIYSLGVLAYQMLAGRLPRTVSGPGSEHTPDELSKLRPDIPAHAALAIAEALSGNAAARPRTPRAFAEALLHPTEPNADGHDSARGSMALDFLRDTRIAIRTLRRTPSFAMAVILTFGLGIGASVSMFSVYDGVLLKPLPYPESDRIVRLFQLNEKGARGNVSEPNYLDWEQGTRSFAAMAQMAQSDEPVSGGGEPMVTKVTSVSRGFFDVMGVRPAGGRTFLPDEQRAGAAPVVVVSSGFWRRMHEGETRRPTNNDTVRFGSETYTVVGVMPPGFDYPIGTNLWTARERRPPQTARTAHNFQAVARLEDGVRLSDAQAEISSLSRALKSTYQDQTWMFDATAVPILEVATGASRRALDMLFMASILLLVVAAANVSNLMVARAAARQKEFAVQLSLGATSLRLRLQALAEALVLCVAGGLLGVAIAAVVVPLFATLGPSSAPRLDAVGVNWSGVALALLASSGVALALSVLTATGGRGGSLATTLTESSRGGTGSRRQMRVRQGLIVTEMALTLVLLVGAGLLAKSLRAVLSVNPGYRLENALVADVSLPPLEDRSSQLRFQDSLLERVRALPGVASAGLINDFPLGGGRYSNGTFVEMSRADEFTSYESIGGLSKEELIARSGQAEYRLASPGYFEAMGIPLIRGRFIDESDGRDAPQVAVISQLLARTKWPDQDPLGRYIQFGNMDGDLRGMRVIGVVGDVRELSPESRAQPVVYGAAAQRPVKVSSFSLIVRGPEPDSISARVRSIAHELDPLAPVRIRTVDMALDEALGSRRFNLWLIGAFSVVAFALSALGVYGLIAFTVSQRVREMGIRMVLGAENGALVGLIVKGGLTLAAIGSAAGLLMALAMTRALDGLLFDVKASDPVVLVSAVLATLATAAAASYVPARRVLRVAPTECLRDI